LTTDESREVIDAFARLGTREVSLIGGEAYLRADWTDLVRAIRSHGIYCAVQTGGRNLTRERLHRAVDAGLQGIGVSLDGLEPLHDEVRGVPGSFRAAVDALTRARDAGLHTSVNTQIGARTMEQLPRLMDTIIEAGATHWQVQLTVAMGNAVDNDHLLLQPYRLGELMPLLARLYVEGLDRGLLMIVGNNIGYFGPYEHLWRGFGDDRVHWTGCSAGQTVLALEADGTVKGCPSLATNAFAGGNVRDLSLEDLWRAGGVLDASRIRSQAELWGFCASCYYADVCRGGCTWTAHSLLGRAGNNPYCHYRVLQLASRGLRERIVKVRDAPGESFAIGRFDVVAEHAESGAIVGHALDRGAGGCQESAETLRDTASRGLSRGVPESHVPPTLGLCRGCNSYIWPDEVTCPHCAADVAAKAREHGDTMDRVERLEAQIRELLREADVADV
jgi:Y-X(10)_GDL-associated radical SAM protein